MRRYKSLLIELKVKEQSTKLKRIRRLTRRLPIKDDYGSMNSCELRRRCDARAISALATNANHRQSSELPEQW